MYTCLHVYTLSRKELLPPLLCAGSLEANLHPDRTSGEEVKREGESCCKASSVVNGNGSSLHAKMSSLIASSRYLKRQTLVSSEGCSLYSGPLRIISLIIGGQLSHSNKETGSKVWAPTQTARSRDRAWMTSAIKGLRSENFNILCLLLKGIKYLHFRIAQHLRKGFSKPACKELGSHYFYLQKKTGELMKINNLS